MNYIHGGNIYLQNINKDEIIDFSSNINPLGVPKSLKDNILEGLNNVAVYPDINYNELKNNIIKYLNVDFLNSNNIIQGNGAAEIIDLSISMFKSILIVVPSFLEYELSAKKYNLNINYFYKDQEFNINYEMLLKEFIDTNSDALVIANPNNPDGIIIDKNKFKSILDYAEANNKTIIIDEAFIEFVQKDNISLLNEVSKYKCLFIIRAVTKFFALPGIRLGYGITNNINLLNNIKEKQLPWNVNSFAELSAKYCFKDDEYIAKTKEWIISEIVYMIKNLNEITFIEKVSDTNTNFILCKLKNVNCDELYNKCLNKNILIRKAYNFKGLDNTYVRFAIKDREKNTILINALKDIENSL